MFKSVSIVLVLVVALGLGGCIFPKKNKPPSVARISCPVTAKAEESVAISVVAYDPNRDRISYKVAFGDGIQSEWSELLPSGQAKVFHHTYGRAGNFGVYAIASDQHHLNSGWSQKTFIKVGPPVWFMYYLAGSGKSIGVKTAPVVRVGNEIKIPAKLDWTDHGVVFSKGPSGSWDARLTGMLSPCTVIKKNGTFFLYYIGADGNRSTDGGPRHRALGVATSSDGLHFTKRGRILTYLPHNNEEEGIFSAGTFLDDNGEVVLYYSALDAGSPTSTTVDSDVRLAVSSNGLNFSDKGDVISHADSKVWGYGDELFPVGAFRQGSTHYVYYIAKGYGANWDLGLAWGPGRGSVGNNTKRVLALSPWIIGGCDPMYLSSTKIALFISIHNASQVRTASVNSPWALSSVVESYSVTKDYPGIVYLDAAR